MFVEVNESIANVNYILLVVQNKWGKDFVLVTQDGLTIDNESGTQGETWFFLLVTEVDLKSNHIAD